MFGWNQKRVGLTIAITCVAGCTGLDFRVRPSTTNGSIAARDAGIASAKQAPAPSILPQTHFAAAKLFESQGMFNKAIRQYRKAVAVNHHYAEAEQKLALLLSRIGRHREAVRTFQLAVAIKPRDPVLQNNLGFELLLTGKLPAAEKAFLEAIRLDDTFARAYVNLGIAQGRQRRFDEALSTFQIVLPEADAYYNLALIHRGSGDLESATATLRHVLTIDPDFTAAQRQLDQLATRISALRESAALAAKAETAARQAVVAKRALVAPVALTPQPERTKAPATKPQPPMKTTGETRAWTRMIAMANDVLEAPIQPVPVPTKPRATKPKTAEPSTTKPTATKPALTKPKPVAMPATNRSAMPTPVALLEVRPQAKPVEVPLAARTDVQEMGPLPETIERSVKVAEVESPKATESVPTVPAGSTATARAAKPRPAVMPTKPIAQPTPTPEVVAMIERRHDVAGFQTHRPDLDGRIEILANEINCINEARVDADATPAPDTLDAAIVADDVIDFSSTFSSEARTPVVSAWSLELGSIVGPAPGFTPGQPIDVAALKPADDDEPCEEALVIDYVPASDPVRVMGECTLAFDPSLPVVYAEESFVPAGYDGMGYVLTKSETASPVEGFTCPAIVEDQPAAIRVAVKAPRPIETGPISSVNRIVVLRHLDERLMVVRNEIACLESAEDGLRTARRAETKKEPNVRLVSEHDTETRRHDRPRRRIESTNARRVRGSRHPGAGTVKSKRRLKATGIAPTNRPRRSTRANSAANARHPRRRHRRQSLRWNGAFKRLDGLTQIVANEIRCMADEALEDSVARRAAEDSGGVASIVRSSKTGSSTAAVHRQAPNH